MKKAILFPLLFAGSAAAAGAGGYYIYSTSTGEQTGKGVIINKSSQTSPKKDLSATVDETPKQEQNQDQNQEQNQEPEKNVETDLSDSVEKTQKRDLNQEKTPEPEKNVETDLSDSVDEIPKQEQNQEQNQEKTPEPEKNVKTDLSASVDETKKQDPNQEPEKKQEKELSTSINETEKKNKNQEKIQEPEKDLQKDNNQSIRVGFWNIKKYTNKINKKQSNNAKTFAIANVINSTGSDAVGLAEITTTGDGADIVKELEKLDPSAGWKQITTNKYGKKHQEEKYTFLYKSSLLETINFEEKSNPYLIQDGIQLQKWSRPVAAVKFKTKTNIKNDFTLAIGHFDSPGQYRGTNNDRKENKDREAPGQGDQEANEARDLANVLAKIDEKDGPNNEIIFMGDTNILAKNTEKLFETTLKSYKLLLDKDEKTTLSSKNFGEYSNSYDKIFYKGDLKTKNAQKFNLYSIFDNKIVDLEEYDEMREQDKRPTKDKSRDPKDIERIKGISDHTMIYFDLELSESDTN
ncbi:endonuclease/exonuclease/phosphatase family protein [Mesomycoplasma ovipneumoniae]|uniref:endonuclease/exonuclease/phosphatase family protein n=1 Tax=Mesomycoplasma ovipneumoniae TaxID=29562 RepID=UPI0026E2B054|nr:endonuclease/exonuclease/phosphatase family protein [Mesomycoplasma ovipneumoniae]MDO6856200.1 endonuclease/exonuclease/phosphatase family protein [Mesomycoplasma ovipneumoniae]